MLHRNPHNFLKPNRLERERERDSGETHKQKHHINDRFISINIFYKKEKAPHKKHNPSE
jgi:hypothetical protein